MIKKERNCFDMKIEIYLNLCVVSKRVFTSELENLLVCELVFCRIPQKEYL